MFVLRRSTILKCGACLALAALLATAFMFPAAAWTRFRGPGGAGTADATNLPAMWDSQKNVVWSTALPGPGASCPIVLDGRIYVTSYSGYAESIDEPGDMNALKRHLVCIDRASGKILWSKQFDAKMPESEYKGSNNTRHGYASSTPTTDGERLYVFFGLSGVFAFDFDGNQLWHADVGSGTHGWGSATSPVLYKNLLIVNASVESQALVALDTATGKEVWRAEGIKSCWASPILVDVAGKQEVVLNVPKRLTAYDPETGKELWYCDGIDDGYLCPSVIAHEGVVYVTGARKNQTIAVRAGGQGDVTQTHVLWRKEIGSNVSSLVYLDGHLYGFHESRGKAHCLDAATGETVYEADLEPRPGLVYASATAADGKLYAPSQEDGVYVVAAKPTFELLAVNKFQDDASRTNASVVVDRNQLLVRTDKALYCIGQ